MKAWKRALLLLGLFALFETLYQLALRAERSFFPQTPVCALILGAVVSGLLVAIVILNRGFDPSDVSADSFSPSLSRDEREKLAAKANKNKKTARALMNVFIPLAFVFSLDLLDLYFDIFDRIKGLFTR